MSTNPPDDTLTYLNSLNFTGGFPTSKDLAPSVVFVILYALTLPVFLFRVFRAQDRCLPLIRPGIFLGARLGMLILRAIMAKKTYGEGELIGELVLVSVGFLFLIEPYIAIWKRHLASAVTANMYPTWVNQLARLLRLTLIAAIVTAVVGSSIISDSNQINTVKALREASYVLSLGVTVVLAFALILTHVRFGLAINGTIYILVPTCCLIIVAVYRVAQIFTYNVNAPVRADVAFWILQVTFEFIAYCFLLAVSIPCWFPKNGQRALAMGNDVEMGPKAPSRTEGAQA